MWDKDEDLVLGLRIIQELQGSRVFNLGFRA